MRSKEVSAATPHRNKRKRSAPKKAKAKTLFSVYGKVFRINNNILKEIRKLQCSVLNLIPKLPFSRLVREILQEYAASNLRIQHSALLGLQVAAEMYMTDFFEDSYLCTLHARRITLQPKDMQLAKRIRGHLDIINK